MVDGLLNIAFQDLRPLITNRIEQCPLKISFLLAISSYTLRAPSKSSHLTYMSIRVLPMDNLEIKITRLVNKEEVEKEFMQSIVY